MQKLLNQSKLLSVLKYITAALLLVVPLYPKFPIFNVPGTYVAIRAEDFVTALLSVFLLLYILSAKRWDIFKNKVCVAIFFFWLAGFLSSLSAMFLTKTVVSHIVLFHWARRVEYMIPFFAAYLVTSTIGRSRFFIQNLLIATFFVFIFGFGQIHWGFPVITTQNEEYSKGLALRWIPGARLSSTFAGHYDLAAFLVLLLPLTTTLFFYYKKLKNKLLFLVFSIFPAFWLMLKTESRVSFISFLVGVSVALWILKKRLFIIPILTLSVLVAVFFSTLGARYRIGVSTYWQRLIKVTHTSLVPIAQAQGENAPTRQRSRQEEKPAVSVPNILEDRSAAIRLNIEWPRALRAFAKNPLLGTGYSSITLATDNDYLRALGEAGLVGAVSFLLIFIKIWESVVRGIKTSKKDWNFVYLVGFAGSLIGILINATFIDVFEASKIAIIFWTLAGIAVGVAEREKTT